MGLYGPVYRSAGDIQQVKGRCPLRQPFFAAVLFFSFYVNFFLSPSVCGIASHHSTERGPFYGLGKGVLCLELDYNKLLCLVSEMGYRLMESGAEIYRVEESIRRLLQAYGVAQGEVFAIPNCIIISLTSPQGHPLTQIRRMPAHGTDIYLLEQYNGLCRRLCSQTPPFDDALEQMTEIQRNHRIYPLWIQLLAYFLGCGMFSLFYGGSPLDGVCGGLCGVVIGICLTLTSRLGANLFFKTVAGGAASALAAVLLIALGVGNNLDLIIIGALMALVPGIAITNAMRDIMAGDMVAGISKGAEALLIGAAIALGTALSLGLTQMFMGG